MMMMTKNGEHPAPYRKGTSGSIPQVKKYGRETKTNVSSVHGTVHLSNISYINTNEMQLFLFIWFL